MKALSLVLLLLVGPLAAQERPAPAANPLAQLKDEVKRVLADAAWPEALHQEPRAVPFLDRCIHALECDHLVLPS